PCSASKNLTHVHRLLPFTMYLINYLPFTSLFLIIPTNMILTKTKRKPTMFHVTINLTTLLTFPIQLSFIISLSTKLILFLSLLSSLFFFFFFFFHFSPQLLLNPNHISFNFFASLSYIQILSP
ncbi:unnamed protein product, partial [Vicia faba]